MPFEKGREKTGGRTKKLKTQVKDFIKEHPYAVETLMQTLYERGIKGDRESAIFIIEQIRGKAKAHVDVDLEGGELLGAGVVAQLFQIMAQKRREMLTEGSQEVSQDAI